MTENIITNGYLVICGKADEIFMLAVTSDVDYEENVCKVAELTQDIKLESFRLQLELSLCKDKIENLQNKVLQYEVPYVVETMTYKFDV